MLCCVRESICCQRATTPTLVTENSESAREKERERDGARSRCSPRGRELRSCERHRRATTDSPALRSTQPRERERRKSKLSLARPRACEQASASLVDTEVQEAAAGERKVHRREHGRRSCAAIDVRRCATELRACVRVCASARTHDADSCERGRITYSCVYRICVFAFASGAINRLNFFYSNYRVE